MIQDIKNNFEKISKLIGNKESKILSVTHAN